MSPFQQALGNAKLAIMCLVMSLIVSLSLNIFLGFALARAPKEMRVAIWQLDRGYTGVKYGQLMAASAFGFAQNIWLSLNNWQVSGYVNAPKKITALTQEHLVSNRFVNQYATLLKSIEKQGFAKDYRQIAMSDTGGFYKQSDTLKEGNSIIVHIRTLSLFYYHSDNSGNKSDPLYQSDQDKFNAISAPLNNHPVKSLVIDYFLRVVPYPNKVGMAIEEIVGTPKVISQKTQIFGGGA